MWLPKKKQLMGPEDALRAAHCSGRGRKCLPARRAGRPPRDAALGSAPGLGGESETWRAFGRGRRPGKREERGTNRGALAGGGEDPAGGHGGDFGVWKARFCVAVETGAVARGWKVFPSEEQPPRLTFLGPTSTDLKTTAQDGFGGQFLLAGARSSGLFQKGGSQGSFAPQETETLPSPLSGARVTAGIQRIEARDASSSALRCAGQPHGTSPWQRISGPAPNVDRAEFETPAVEGIPALHCFRADAKPPAASGLQGVAIAVAVV